ncbi:MAG TPA: MFS transporter [Chloroflexota bacterium]|jgi:MFS family permease
MHASDPLRFWARTLSRDGWLLFAACGVRNFAYGFLSVVLGVYLSTLGLSVEAIGGIFTASLAGGAAMTLMLTSVADRLGRRQILLLGAALMAAAGVVFALTDQVIVLTLAAVLGTISPSGKEVGPFLSVEQAILPQTTSDARRTEVFAAYNLVNYLATALGALVVGVPALLGLSTLQGYLLLIWGYAAVGVVLLLLFAALSPAVEAGGGVGQRTSRPSLGLRESRGTVAKLATLFAVDSFAGGFVVQGLLALWFYLRYGFDVGELGAVFFGTNLLAALSFLAAPGLARRFGLLNTMVFTHLPSNVLLLLVPLMPSAELAVAVLLIRYSLSQLDVPTRQSYTMAIVPPEERAAAAGIFSVARNAAAAIAPAFAGITLAVPAVGLPFIVAGGLKIAYDLTIFAVFRGVQPPEERARVGAVTAATHR